MLINEKYQAPLNGEIIESFNKLISLFADTNANHRSTKNVEGTGGKVSIADLIAYQIGWGTLLIYWYETGLKGIVPQMPGEGFSKWDYAGLAQRFHTKYHFDGYKKQEEEFYTVVKKILTIVEHEYEAKNLDKEGVWKWCTLSSGKQWPLSKWVRVNTVAPYKRAAASIKKSNYN